MASARLPYIGRYELRYSITGHDTTSWMVQSGFQNEEGVLGCRRTDCRLAAASAGNTCKNANDLVREAVGYSGVFGRTVFLFVQFCWILRCVCWPCPLTLYTTAKRVACKHHQTHSCKYIDAAKQDSN